MSKNIGLLGYGVVGRGVFDLVKENEKKHNIKITKVFDRVDKKEELKDLLVLDFFDICLDKDIDIVIEALGGDEVPYKAITTALKNGKSVITSNKETISKHLDEYISLAKENGVGILFEASVGGGIPLLHNVINIASFDKITHIRGILNGTSNYILSKMDDEGMEFYDALKLAQKEGFAESDPSADLEGVDIMRKGIIISSLAFNKELDYRDCKIKGIEKISKKVIDYAKGKGKVIKLLLDSYLVNDDVYISVLPCLLSEDEIIAKIKNEENCVEIDCLNNSRIRFIGKGAGRSVTASAIMQDLMHILVGAKNINRDFRKSVRLNSNVGGNFLLVNEKDEIEEKEIENIYEANGYKFVAKIL